MNIVWRDGEFLAKSEFKISPMDRGLCHGLSFFETLLVVNGRPQLFDEHMDRLISGLCRLGIEADESYYYGLRATMVTLIEKNGLTKDMARLRFSVSFGEGALNQVSGKNSWAWMTVMPLETQPESVRVITAPWKKAHEGILCGLKTGNYAEPILAMDFARRADCQEAIFFNTADQLCEAAMANIFLIRDGELFTPHLGSGCLPGVTRALLLHLAKRECIACHEIPLSRNDLDQADCAFLSSSTKGPVLISECDGRSYQNHPFLQKIQDGWRREMSL